MKKITQFLIGILAVGLIGAPAFGEDTSEVKKTHVPISSVDVWGGTNDGLKEGQSVLARILALFPLTCPRCGQQMQIIAFVTGPTHLS